MVVNLLDIVVEVGGQTLCKGVVKWKEAKFQTLVMVQRCCEGRMLQIVYSHFIAKQL